MSQPLAQSTTSEMSALQPSSHAALLNKSRQSTERSKRRRAKKIDYFIARCDAIPTTGLGPEGQWPAFGPMKVVEGQAVGGFLVSYPTQYEGSTEWRVDPLMKDSERIQAEQKHEKGIEENLKYWPWGQTIPRTLVMFAPFLFNNFRDTKTGQPFAFSEADQQNCLLFKKLFSNQLLGQKLIDLLFINHDTARRFSLTSRQSTKCINHYTTNWDFSRGWFGNCEIEREHFVADQSIAAPVQGSVPSVVIVSPIRGPLFRPKNMEDLDHVEETFDEPLFERQVCNLHKMCKAMYNFADFFGNLQLHRIPFLTTEVLSLIIPLMRNLQVLGLYKCPLIHVGHTMKVLEIIQIDRVRERQNQISVDFYPNYHVGPASDPGKDYIVGSYGVTWDNWNGDSCLSIWQLVSIIMPQARSQKQDFWSKHTMFRQWLDKSPCWRVAETLAAIQRSPGDTRTNNEIEEDFVVMVDFPETGGSKARFKKERPNRPEGWKWQLERHPCHVCGLNALGTFFHYDDIRQAANLGLIGAQLQLKCMACRLIEVLDNETDHYKREKRAIIKHWLKDDYDDGGWNIMNMPKALTDFTDRNVAVEARKLCRKRWNKVHRRHKLFAQDPILYAQYGQWDREYDERQTPYSRDEKGRLGLKNRSPTVHGKDPVYDAWNTWDNSRTFAHGH